jgi:hypothetical protein
MLRSPITFRIRVSHQAQEPPSESLPAELGIQQSASPRSYNEHRPHRARNQLPPDAHQQTATVHDLEGHRLLRTRVLSGIINEYRYTA